MSTNINLLLRTDGESVKQKRKVRALNSYAIWSLVGVGLISLCLFVWIQIINLGDIKKEQQNILAKMSEFQGRQVKLFVLNDRVTSISNIFKTRKDLSKITASLLIKIPGNLLVNDFEVDGQTVIIAGESRSLAVIGEFINNLTDMVVRKEIIKSLTLNSLSLDTGKNTYQVSIKSDL
jgi:hypothetical protein